MARGDVRQAANLLEIASQRSQDASTLLRLATVRRSVGDLSGAMHAAAAAVELSPRNFLMAMLLGSLRESSGAFHAAERAYRAACNHVPVDLTFQPALQSQLQRSRQLVERFDRWRRELLDWQPGPSLGSLDSSEERRLRKFRSNIVENLDSGPLAPPVFMVPGIRTKSFLEPESFSGVSDIERASGVIRDEFLALAIAENEISVRLNGLKHDPKVSSRAGNWSMIPLIKNGVVSEFASACPRTMELAGALDCPRLGLISPSLYFSVLSPNSRIAPHTGITNARVIVHFPLIVPEKCGFRVGEEIRQWEVGKALVFDDMAVHEAWNDSDRIRVVLIADLWRPELTPLERMGVEMLMDV